MFQFDEAYKRSAHRAWAALCRGEEQEEGGVRPVILRSWQRSMAYGVDPLSVKKAVHDSEDVRRRSEANRDLLLIARSYMERLYSIVSGSGFYLMISDADGVVLDLIGDEDIVREGRAKSNLVVGADRSERTAGTNAIGTSLATSEPIQIWGEEHFVKSHKIYACSGAPILGENGAVLGCLNLTGLAENVHPHTLGMVLSAALGISKELEILHRPKAKTTVGFAARYSFSDILGTSALLLGAVDLAKKAASGDSNILLLGESGVGKELFAQAIHRASRYAGGPFVALNCAAMPAGLIESELFGYEAGAFTGAAKSGNPGKFELADGGTIFLDEIGDMPLDVQASLLRVIETREIVRIGGRSAKTLHVRIVAATNQNLTERVREGLFREDLYYRLHVIAIQIPPLRVRKEDIPALAEHFARAKGATGITKEALRSLAARDWPGNIRELENAIERATGLTEDGVITEQNVLENELPQSPPREAEAPPSPYNMESLEKDALLRALAETGGNVTKAAALLGISRRTIYRKMGKVGVI
ncbi:MAG: sigma 54-interacting transcriptional regulator [Clostridiales Family XIII bacterium]|jgi:transcriptional regulator of acetoin/glycerol metabolism|nr:sigma 54-interacting transcriptional regulator [Clostridiales Family XIII bacterium]